MLYNPGDLTEEQAEKIIGKKMMKKIKAINEWAKKNGYIILCHSTWKDYVDDIFEKGLDYNIPLEETETREDILKDTNVPESDLDLLEKWLRDNPKKQGTLSKMYETCPGIDRDTVIGSPQITAKSLLEKNHQGGDVTIIFCVPIKRDRPIGREDTSGGVYSQGTKKRRDLYLRRKISGKKDENGKVIYTSKYLYPTQGILMAFDRESHKVKYNKSFDETSYLESTMPQKRFIKRGDLTKKLEAIDIEAQKEDHDEGDR